MTTRRRKPTRRRRPVTAALLRLSRDWRLWALLPAEVTHILLDVNPDDDMGDVIGEVARPKRFPKGVCSKCGCTELDACHTTGGPCEWVDRTKTLCTACEGQ